MGLYGSPYDYVIHVGIMADLNDDVTYEGWGKNGVP